MKKLILYTCEFCHTSYANERSAKECEISHYTNLSVFDASYRPRKVCGSSFPCKIIITDDCGHKAMYEKGKELQ